MKRLILLLFLNILSLSVYAIDWENLDPTIKLQLMMEFGESSDSSDFNDPAKYLEIYQSLVKNDPFSELEKKVKADHSFEEMQTQAGFSYSTDQKLYWQQFYHASATGLMGYQLEKWNFMKLLSYLALRRNQMAKKLGHEDFGDFGKLRYLDGHTFTYSTPISKRYKKCISEGKLKSKLNECLVISSLTDIPNILEETNTAAHGYLGEALEETFEVYVIRGKIDDNEIVMTQTSFIRKFPNKCAYKKYFRPDRRSKGKMVGVFYHPFADKINFVLKHLDKIFTQIMNMSSPSIDELQESIAEFHWWFANIMPFQRGSESVAEMFVHIMLGQHGHKFKGWKEGISPDIQAFLESDLEVYAGKYKSYFKLGK